jgi:uncharacterized protein YutE (UPF0331/DUF86 family)/predicted nucleotidyltransferase
MALADDLTAYFSTCSDVAFALLFGSAAAGRQTAESDVDVAVYLLPPDEAATLTDGRTGIPEVEAESEYDGESELWADLERIAGRNVDLVILNRAAATVAASALLTGVLVNNRNPGLYRKFFLTVTSLAEEQREFVRDFVEIKRRSQSLTEVDRARLLRIIDFLEDELQDADEFADLDLTRYANDRTTRRSVERWVENLVNASIDAAKIVLASEHMGVPQTYAETVSMLAAVKGFWPDDEPDPQETALQLARNTRVRNMLAHEYLDLRFTKVDQVVDHAAQRYGSLIRALRAWMGQE